MTADLSRARLEIGEVLVVERLGGGLLELVARLPHLAACATPGQFAQLRCGAGSTPLLRRPFSVAWTQDDTCGFVFEAVGVGTRILSELRPGDPLDSLGPLGHGFTLTGEGPVVCVSGGLGCAPFPLLIGELRRRGVEDILVLNGARTANRLYPAERFARPDLPVTVAEATDDGTRGHHGPVTELLVDRPARRAPVGALRVRTQPHAQRGDGHADRVGHGAAGGARGIARGARWAAGSGRASAARCRCSTGDRSVWRLCCTDGPVMPMRDVDWAGLSALPGADVA